MVKRIIILLLISSTQIFPSGGYDHGTSTGKGQLELDFTWNPFDLIEYGQSYIVVGYGLTDYFDIHGYFAHQTNKNDNYYAGLFYQFIDTKYIDLATAVGVRKYTDSKTLDIFAPQLLFNFKVHKKLAIGGAIVDIKRNIDNELKHKGTAFDIAFLVPLSNVIELPKFITEIKLVFGVFNPGVFDSEHGELLPTYSIDITFKKFFKE